MYTGFRPVECRYPARYRNSARMECRFVRPNRHSTGTPTPKCTAASRRLCFLIVILYSSVNSVRVTL